MDGAAGTSESECFEARVNGSEQSYAHKERHTGTRAAQVEANNTDDSEKTNGLPEEFSGDGDGYIDQRPELFDDEEDEQLARARARAEGSDVLDHLFRAHTCAWHARAY